VVLVAVPVFFLWAYTLRDLYLRTDLAVLRKLAWVAGIVLLPILGPVIYLVVRPSRRGDIAGFG
jgi:hypothetical protein